MEGTKVCIKCGRELPLSEFYKNNKAKDGRASQCRECYAEYLVKYKQKKEQEFKSARLSNFTPRDLMHELAIRGFEGELPFKQEKEKEATVDGVTGIFKYVEVTKIDITNF